MGIQDLYKLVYQGVMGSGHAVSSNEAAESWLQRELIIAGEKTPQENMLEEVSADGKVIRVNLRPFVAAGGNTDRLLTAFIRTGREYRGSNEELIYWWETAVSQQTGFSRDEMTEFIEIQRKEYFPAVHHSKVYSQLYRPSYRVVLRSLCFEEGVQLR